MMPGVCNRHLMYKTRIPAPLSHDFITIILSLCIFISSLRAFISSMGKLHSWEFILVGSVISDLTAPSNKFDFLGLQCSFA